MTFAGIVLAGGAATRLGGVDKPSLEVGGRTLIEIATAALDSASHVSIVGREVAGGPVAAIAAALREIGARTVVVLAADLPFVTAAAIDDLISARGDARAAIAVDAGGRDQPLLGCYDAHALRAALPSDADGASMRTVTAMLDAAGEVRRVDLGGDPPVCADCDTPLDLVRARELV
ncbi:MAG: NTP transferase domain-containing protein [Frankiaceae bacterium]|nr:NTP transferase domain-containing protein [Frankiaceae bacterium]MBV9869099.1 NTP transferase domain-containing protein [Frankiaceae bacterium]